MTQETIAAARERHERDNHIEDFDVCPNPACQEANREINLEAAIEGMKTALRTAEAGNRRKV